MLEHGCIQYSFTIVLEHAVRKVYDLVGQSFVSYS